MIDYWFTSDTHFSHDRNFVYEPRGFTSVEEMNEAIVERWNKVVKSEDIVYHLGDFALNDVDAAISYISRLNGTIHWIRGNHDGQNKIYKIMEECPGVWEQGWADQIKIGRKYNIYLSHYPTLTANFDDKHFNQHVISLHGHTHQKTNWLQPDNPFMYHVGLDSHNCTPIHIDEIITDIRNRWAMLGLNQQNIKSQS